MKSHTLLLSDLGSFLNTHAFSIYVLSAWGIEVVKCSQHLAKLRILLLFDFIKITTRLRTSKLTSLQVREHTNLIPHNSHRSNSGPQVLTIYIVSACSVSYYLYQQSYCYNARRKYVKDIWRIKTAVCCRNVISN